MSLGINPTLFLIFVFAALTIYALIRTVAPFLEDPEEQIRMEMLDEELEQIEQLVARKSVLLQSLQDVEFDHQTGKLSDEDYERLKQRYERQAVRVMRELDEIRGGVDMEDEIDEALRRRLDGTANESEEADEEERADEDTASRPAEPSDSICPECGRELEADARFCSGCGVRVDGQDDSEDDSADGESERDGAERKVGELRSEATG